MDILHELKQTRDRINAAIEALNGKTMSNGRRGTKSRPGIRTVPTIGRRTKRRLSAAARKKISQAAKARWARAKKAGKTSL